MTRIALALLLSLACIPAYGGPPPGTPQHCQSPAAANAEIDAAIAIAGGERIVLEGKEAEAYLGVMNREPPATDVHSALIVLYVRPPNGTVIGVLSATGQVCIIARIGPKTHEEAIRAARGEDT